MKYKLVSMTLYGEKEYTVYKVLCKKRWYLPWKGVTIGGNLCSYDLLHEWYSRYTTGDYQYKTIADNLIDACYEIIIKLHEQKLL